LIFIVDTNRIIAGLIRDSTSREILLNPNFEFYTPDYLLTEIKNHKDLIMKKGGFTERKFKTIYELLIDRINVSPKSEIMNHFDEANKIIGNIDPDDVTFIALALSIPNNGIWTEDNHFKKQKKIKIWSTKEIFELINTMFK
jgi:predicted nucleic acid-binding protein